MTQYDIETLRTMRDEENTVYELFVSHPRNGASIQKHPYGVRVIDEDAEEIVAVRRFKDYDSAATYYAEITP